MSTRRRLLAGAAAAVAVIAGAVFTVGTASAESNGGVKVMPLGDSITDGLNVPGGYRINLWQKLVADRYTVDFVGSLSNGPASLGDHDHEGHSGWTIAQIDANVNTWMRNYSPRTILLHIGTNDIYGSDPGGAPNRLGTLIDHITTAAPNAELFVSTIIPLGFSDQTVRTYNAAIPGIVRTRANAGKHVHLVDMYPALTTSDLADGVHPNAGGYAKMATVWYNALLAVPGSLTNGTPTAPPTTTPPTAPPTSKPPTAPPTTTPPTSTPPVGSSGCTAAYAITNQWQGGFQANVTVTAGNAAIRGWTVTWTFANGQTVGSSWGATLTASGAAVTARNAAYNGALAAGGTTSFGFVGSGSASNPAPALTCTAS